MKCLTWSDRIFVLGMYDYVAVVSKMLLYFRSPVKRLSFQLLLMLFRMDMRCSINIVTQLWLKILNAQMFLNK